MDRCILATRPEHDVTTFYLSQWCKPILKDAQEKGIEVIDLLKDNANKNKVEAMISKKKPKILILNGHGNEGMVAGHKNEPIIIINTNEEILKSRIVYTISCKSAERLGPSCIEKGTESYIGYDDDFIFVFDKNKTAAPIKDDLAKIFIEPSNELILSLIKGNTSEEAYKRSQEKFKRNIQKLLSSESPLGSENHVRYLFWDMKHQVILGNRNSHL